MAFLGFSGFGLEKEIAGFSNKKSFSGNKPSIGTQMEQIKQAVLHN